MERPVNRRRRSSFTSLTLSNISQLSQELEEPNDQNEKNPSKFAFNIPWRQLLDLQYLASGGSALIYTANYDNASVIIKTVNPETEGDNFSAKAIEEELKVLQKLDHPNVIKFYGAGHTLEGRRFLILETLAEGTLDSIIEHDKASNHHRTLFSRPKTLILRNVVEYARSIASAMAHCHSAVPNKIIIHRDLKPENIAFSNGELKVFDFGLARVIENVSPYSDQVFKMSGGTGSMRYMAPECLACLPYNHKVDVYSFAIILWEMLSCSKPYAGFTADVFEKKIVLERARPAINRKWPSALIEIMEQCWDHDYKKRPTFGKIKGKLDHFYKEHLNENAGNLELRRIKRTSPKPSRDSSGDNDSFIGRRPLHRRGSPKPSRENSVENDRGSGRRLRRSSPGREEIGENDLLMVKPRRGSGNPSGDGSENDIHTGRRRRGSLTAKDILNNVEKISAVRIRRFSAD